MKKINSKMACTNLFSGCIFLFVTFSACSEKVTEAAVTEKKSTTNINVKPIEAPTKILTPKNAEEIVDIPKGIDSNLVVSISRSGCYGKCAAYSFSVMNDGKAMYEGRAHVTKLGSYVAQISKSDLNNFLNAAKELTPLSFNDKYPIKGVTVTDLPTTKTYLRFGNSGKLVINNYDAPKEVLDLETRIEMFAESLHWKKTEK